jgi:hypothetical protein
VIARIAVALVGVVLVGGSLAGCSHRDGASQIAPGASTSGTTPAPTTAPAAGGSDSSLRDVQGDLNSADSATANAGADVADADSSAATNDSP